MSPLKAAFGIEDHLQGSVDAACILVEYGDYQCPHCRAAHSVVQRIRRHFGQRLGFVFRNFPLTKIHPDAEAAAEVAEYAATQGKFWEMHDLLLDNQDELGTDLYRELATQIGIDPAALLKSLADGTCQVRVRSDFSGGIRSGVNGTPTFFIQGRRFDGPMDFDHIVAAIDEAQRQ